MSETRDIETLIRKLLAEERKLSWDRWLAPLIAAATLIGALGISRFFAH